MCLILASMSFAELSEPLNRWLKHNISKVNFCLNENCSTSSGFTLASLLHLQAQLSVDLLVAL